MRAQATTDEAERQRLTRQMYRFQFDQGGWIIPLSANVENAHHVETADWPKNDFAGRTAGNGHFEQVYLTN